MRTETIEAVYEHGTFRPVAPVDLELAEGQKVRLVVEPFEDPDEMLALARRVYEGLTDEQIDAIEKHTARRADFFGERTSTLSRLVNSVRQVASCHSPMPLSSRELPSTPICRSVAR